MISKKPIQHSGAFLVRGACGFSFANMDKVLFLPALYDLHYKYNTFPLIYNFADFPSMLYPRPLLNYETMVGVRKINSCLRLVLIRLSRNSLPMIGMDPKKGILTKTLFFDCS